MTDKRIIAILDTGFDDHHPSIRALWEGFEYRKHDLLSGGDLHAHGTMVANFLMRPFDVDNLRDKVVFHHIRVGDSEGRFSMGAVQEGFRLVRELGCTAFNCSWGASDYDVPEMEDPAKYEGPYREVAEWIQETIDAGAVGNFASGNSDSNIIPGGDLDDDVAYPQRLFTRGGKTLIWGSVTIDGYASQWSSDGSMVFACFWADHTPILDPGGNLVVTSGTSFASPKGCGLCESLMASGAHPDYAALEKAAVEQAVHLTYKDGQPVDYVNPETGEKYHNKFGFGTLESCWQAATRESRSRPSKPVALPRIHWINFVREAA